MASLLPTPSYVPAPHRHGSTTQTPYRPLRPPLPLANEGRPRWPSWMESYWTKKMSKKLVMGVRSLCAVGTWTKEGGGRSKRGLEAWRSSYKGLLALYWSIALPCFAPLSWYRVQYSSRCDTCCEATNYITIILPERNVMNLSIFDLLEHA